MPYVTLNSEAEVKAAIQRELLNLAGAKEVFLATVPSFSPKTDDVAIGQNYADGALARLAQRQEAAGPAGRGLLRGRAAHQAGGARAARREDGQASGARGA